METNGLPVVSGMFSGIGSGMLGLEMSLQPQQQQQQPQNPQSAQNPHHLHHHHPQMVAFSHHETDQPQLHQSVKQGYSFRSKTKQQPSPLSDEDETTAGGNKKISPWQRMKWTDNMVRLLIMAVYYIGDEGGSEVKNNNNDPSTNNGKKQVGGGVGLLQKKGKWKSVSRAMMEKGFYVSPQQCEDKFNDLNKRYKRVNDILGRGTACRVVENQSLLETMDLSPKLKEEVRKLLNSKHLFFREMCVYHNSCGHGAGASGAANHSPEVATETSHNSQVQLHQQQQQCLHSSDNAQIASNLGIIETEATELVKLGSTEEEEEEEDDDDDDEDDSDDEEDEDVHGHGHQEDDHENYDEKCSRKRPRKVAVAPLIQQLSCEVVNVMQDCSKTAWEKKHWVKTRLMQLEEQQMNYQYQAYDLEKERVKWMKFSMKKEREMEKAKLENERRRLVNERMVLLVRQQKLELVEIQHRCQHQHQHQPHQQLSSNKRGDPSSITG